jgi:hypothetical protein
MSYSINPWDTTTADFALSPVYQFVLQTEKSAIPLDLPSSCGSALIEKLRSFDEIAFYQREITLQGCVKKVDPEIERFYELENEIGSIFKDLSQQLASFRGNVTSPDGSLQKSYKNLLSSQQMVIWDDISFENKSKLLSLLREIIKRFVHLDCKLGSDLVKFTDSIDFLNLTKDFEEYQIEDLQRIVKQSESLIQHVLGELSPDSSSPRYHYGQDETKQCEIIKLNVEKTPVLA